KNEASSFPLTLTLSQKARAFYRGWRPCVARRGHEVQTSRSKTLSQQLKLPAESLLYGKCLFLFSQISFITKTP
ncbi:MAG TPA: hypothetical protein PKX76_08555, partial [Flexilinea sp.]|nr:hypothetical protein [Flexilinea sp.]